jgi:hypothetical protein
MGLLNVRLVLITAMFILLSSLWTSAAFSQSVIRITFSDDELGKFPSGWTSQDKINMARIYSIRAEEGAKFLHADSTGQAVQIMYEKRFALNDFPMLRWRWRAVTFPEGSNERERNANDSVLGIYVVFSYWPVRAIKYIWSDTLPEGSSFDSPHSSGAKIVVVASGRKSSGAWVTEERNLLEDYQRFFGEAEKNPISKGIAILTDADDTHSHAVGDYSEIEVLGVRERRVASKGAVTIRK